MEWDEQQQAWMLALAAYHAGTCPGCRGQLEETTHPDAERAYVVDPPHRCHRCTALAIKQDQFVKEGGSQPQAMQWSARRV